ncbi:MAG: rhodanese-like domain-containing protein [Planctomycetota bacterium]
MIYAALALAVLAFLIALSARSLAASQKRAIEDAQSDALRRVENLAEETEAKLALMRRVLAQVASGAKLTPEMILEGRLWHEIGASDAVAMVQAGNVRLLDVRTPQETSLGIIPGAQKIPVEELEARVKEVPKDGRKMIVYCAGGSRSAAACEFLSAQGYDELYNLEGGFNSWSGPRAPR